MRAADERAGGRVRRCESVVFGVPCWGRWVRRVGERAVRVVDEGKGPGARAARELVMRVAVVARSIAGEVNVSLEAGEDDMMGAVLAVGVWERWGCFERLLEEEEAVGNLAVPCPPMSSGFIRGWQN